MKRRITVEQLSELTDEQEEKLRSLWIPQTGDIYFRMDYTYDSPLLCEEYDYVKVDKEKNSCLPLLDIGQMIEILHNNEIPFNPPIDISDKFEIDNLCDALWEAVKTLL